MAFHFLPPQRQKVFRAKIRVAYLPIACHEKLHVKCEKKATDVLEFFQVFANSAPLIGIFFLFNIARYNYSFLVGFVF